MIGLILDFCLVMKEIMEQKRIDEERLTKEQNKELQALGA